jgi:hypothetical protein
MNATRQRLRLDVSVALLLQAAASALATDFFVATNGGNQPPYTSWPTAARNLSAAVDQAHLANDGGTVWIANGAYAQSNQIAISNISVRGFSGDRSAVLIDGRGMTRLFHLNHPTALLADLTVTNGYVANTNDLSGNGGGVHVSGSGALLSNCVVTACTATNSGGGVYVSTGRAVNCLIAGNVSQGGASGAAGGLYLATDCVALNCTISNNQALGGLFAAGGVYLSARASISNSVIVGNLGRAAGGVRTYFNARVVNCDIRENMASNGADICGGGLYTDRPTVLRNCLIRRNGAYHTFSSNQAGGGVRTAMSGADIFEMQSCTVVSNYTITSNTGAGGAYLNGTNVLTDCIFYDNKSAFAATWDTYNFVTKPCTNLAFNNCVERPLQPLPSSQGNITNNPQFKDAGRGDYRLTLSSPCVNAGLNQTWMTNAVDLDGNPRIDGFLQRVDIGCYEQTLPRMKGEVIAVW